MKSLTQFTRTAGAKDKEKRKSHLLRNLAIGAGTAAVLGGAAVLAHRKIYGNKKTPAAATISSPQTSSQSSVPTSPPVTEKRKSNSDRIKNRRQVLQDYSSEWRRIGGEQHNVSIDPSGGRLDVNAYNMMRKYKDDPSTGKKAKWIMDASRRDRKATSQSIKGAVSQLRKEGRYFSFPFVYTEFWQ